MESNMDVDNDYYQEIKFESFLVESISNIHYQDIINNQFIIDILELDTSNQEQVNYLIQVLDGGLYKKVVFKCNELEYILYFTTYNENPFGIITINQYNYSVIEGEWLNAFDKEEEKQLYEQNIQNIINWLIEYTNEISITNNLQTMEI